MLYNEIIKSIQNVFDSNITTKTISDETRVAYTTVNELRNNKRDIYSTNVENCFALYNFAVAHKLNQEVLNAEKRKGTYDTLDLKLGVDKVLVAFNRLDLFALGYMVIKNSAELLEKDRLVQLELSNSIFVTERKHYYDTSEFTEQFNCNYNGNGPGNFARFLLNYSKIDRQEIENIIFNNEIVRYDFKNDKIEEIQLSEDLKEIKLNTYNSKLIITMDKDKSVKHELEYYFNKVKIISDILDKQYSKDTKLKRIAYIYSYNSDDTKKYSTHESSINSIHYRIILEFDDFEIWIPYFISKTNAFDNDKMKNFLGMFGVEIRDSGFLEKFFNKINKTNTEVEYVYTNLI